MLPLCYVIKHFLIQNAYICAIFLHLCTIHEATMLVDWLVGFSWVGATNLTPFEGWELRRSSTEIQSTVSPHGVNQKSKIKAKDGTTERLRCGIVEKKIRMAVDSITERSSRSLHAGDNALLWGNVQISYGGFLSNFRPLFPYDGILTFSANHLTLLLGNVHISYDGFLSNFRPLLSYDAILTFSANLGYCGIPGYTN